MPPSCLGSEGPFVAPVGPPTAAAGGPPKLQRRSALTQQPDRRRGAVEPDRRRLGPPPSKCLTRVRALPASLLEKGPRRGAGEGGRGA